VAPPCGHDPATMTRTCRRIVDSRWFDPLMLGVIFVNAITLGLETYDAIEREIGDQLHAANDVILGLFVVELLIRFGADGFSPRRFFRSGWNVFDFVVIGASFLPGLRENATLLRVLRLLRIVRVVRLLPDLRILVVAVGKSIPGVASLAALTLLLIYVYGMVGWVIFHDHDPANFGTLGKAMLSMFILLTLENLPVYIDKGLELSSWTVLFYVSYVLIASFLIFNLFIGVVINSMEEAREATADRDAREHPGRIEDRLRALRDALEDLERELRSRR
jgi:voltage-gated sodium channel